MTMMMDINDWIYTKTAFAMRKKQINLMGFCVAILFIYYLFCYLFNRNNKSMYSILYVLLICAPVHICVTAYYIHFMECGLIAYHGYWLQTKLYPIK